MDRRGYLIPENADAFPSCGVPSTKLIQCPEGGGKLRNSSSPGKQVPASEINGLTFLANNNRLKEGLKNNESGVL
ncbi:hypothetical protein KIS4809_4228 [Bacillus sp. ZZV12-4809]|nr:hypothetical protein KIS4809_4228 [Bacillus sp. ZZV12-4809]